MDTPAKQKPRWIDDLLGLGGLVCLCAGIWAEFGWPWSLIIGGGLIFGLVLVSLMIRGPE